MSGRNKRIIEAAEVLEENLRIAGSNENVGAVDRSQAIRKALGYLASVLAGEMDSEYPDTVIVKQVSRIHRHLVALQDSLQKKRDFDNKKNVDFNHIKIQTALDWVLDGFCAEMGSAGIEEQERNAVIQDLSVRVEDFEANMTILLKSANFANYEAITTPLVIAFNKARATHTKDDTDKTPHLPFLVFAPEVFHKNMMAIVSNFDLPFNEQIDLIQRSMTSLFAILLEDMRVEIPAFEKSEAATGALKSIVSIQKSLYKEQATVGAQDVDLENIKVQAGFDYVIDASIKSMESQGIAEGVIEDIILALGKRMQGFEEDANRRMRDLNSFEIKALKSPFLPEASTA